MSHKATAQSVEDVSTSSLSERVNSSMLLIVSVCGWTCFRRAETQNKNKGITMQVNSAACDGIFYTQNG